MEVVAIDDVTTSASLQNEKELELSSLQDQQQQQPPASSSLPLPATSSHQYQATASMCYYCFDVLIYELYQRQQKQQQSSSSSLTTTSTSSSSMSSQQQQQQQQHSNKKKPMKLSSLFTTSSSSSSSSDVTNSNHNNSSMIPPPSSLSSPKPLTKPIFYHDNNNEYNISNIVCPLFVTWEKNTTTNTNRKNCSMNHSNKTKKSNVYELRGCIGSLSPKNIYDHLYHYIISSAFHDQRFPPISFQNDTITSLRVAVSLLVQYEICNHCYDWNVGTHGIIIKFTIPNDASTTTTSTTNNTNTSNNQKEQTYTATFLPEVAYEQKWDQQITIQQLIRKAGYYGKVSSSIIDAIHCTRYQSSKYYMTFSEYIELYKQRSNNNITNNNINQVNNNNNINNDNKNINTFDVGPTPTSTSIHPFIYNIILKEQFSSNSNSHNHEYNKSNDINDYYSHNNNSNHNINDNNNSCVIM